MTLSSFVDALHSEKRKFFLLSQDGVCSPEDVDICLTQGLAMRWSLIGPFETIHLNAPKGISIINPFFLTLSLFF